MPLYDNTRSPAALRTAYPAAFADFGGPFGECDECCAGSEYNRNSAVLLYSRDNDGGSPWYCGDCMDAGGYRVDDDDDDSGRDAERYDVAHDHPERPPVLLLAAIDGREPRLQSIEQEVAAGSAHIARDLHAAGLAASANVASYHSRRTETGAFARVERDASVEGEVIYDRVRLDTIEGAAKLEAGLGIVRRNIGAGLARLDTRCGFHVHVDAKGMGMEDLMSLYHAFNGVEDTLFRLGSANWPRGHRGTGYTPVTVKGIATAHALGQTMESGRGALNMSNYLASRGHCRCGAFSFADWRSCTCPLPMSTIEFRLFNATANLRKIHAYTAVTLALLGYTRHHTVTPETLPVFAWNARTAALDTESTRRALAFLFETLPLAESERHDLAYVARCSTVAPVFADLYGDLRQWTGDTLARARKRRARAAAVTSRGDAIPTDADDDRPF